jgi:hypothetical protein
MKLDFDIGSAQITDDLRKILSVYAAMDLPTPALFGGDDSERDVRDHMEEHRAIVKGLMDKERILSLPDYDPAQQY